MTENGEARIWRWAGLAVAAALVLMWVYIFSGAAADDPPDQLDDPGFAEAAERRCSAARATVDALPTASEAATATVRADVLDRANDALGALVDDLDAIEAGTARDRDLVRLWIADWRRYVDDRRAFAAELRRDGDAEFLVTARAGRQITLTVDRFATVNDMESCVTPLDV